MRLETVTFLPDFELGDVLFGHVDLVDPLGELAALDDVVQTGENLGFVAGEGVHHVPAARAIERALDLDLFFELLGEDENVGVRDGPLRGVRNGGFVRVVVRVVLEITHGLPYLEKRKLTNFANPKPRPKINDVMNTRTNRTIVV
jgi:hypothetical protein